MIHQQGKQKAGACKLAVNPQRYSRSRLRTTHRPSWGDGSRFFCPRAPAGRFPPCGHKMAPEPAAGRLTALRLPHRLAPLLGWQRPGNGRIWATFAVKGNVKKRGSCGNAPTARRRWDDGRGSNLLPQSCSRWQRAGELPSEAPSMRMASICSAK